MEQVILALKEIEDIIGFSLPDSSRKHYVWWSNNYDHSQAISWMDAGYETFDIANSLRKKQIIFNKCK